MKTTEAAVVAQIVAAAQLSDPIPLPALPQPSKKTQRKTKEAAAMSTTNVATKAATTVATDMYALSAKTARAMDTLQAGAKTGKGTQWRTVAQARPNTRAVALQAIASAANADGAISEQGVLAALATVKEFLGSGSPRSYLRAFTASGYLTKI